MGKIRVKVFDETEQKEKDKKLAAKREAKKAEKEKAKKVDAEHSAVIPVKTGIQEDPQKLKQEINDESNPTASPDARIREDDKQSKPTKNLEPKAVSKYAAKKGLNKKIKSKRYQETAAMVDRKKNYKLEDAVELLKKFKKTKFDETVELHINTREKGISGQVTLPHGTGKTRKIKIADDTTIANIERGVIDFDVLVAHPSMMPKLAKVARILGPRGLMPNPKNGTVTDKPEQAVEKLAGGQVNYKTESTAPIIHLSIGKASFEDNKIAENIKSVIASVGVSKIESATVKLTMSPGVKLNVTTL